VSDIDPATAASMATGDGAEGAAIPNDDAMALSGGPDEQRAETGGSRASLVDGLLETEPPGNVATYPDMPEPAAHLLIGSQKFINGISGDDRIDGGKPAIVDFIQAGVSFFLDAGDDDHADELPADPAPPSEAPGGDVGGDLGDE